MKSLKHFLKTLIALQSIFHTRGKLRIIGGEKAPEDEYEWFYKADGCGASLIAPDMIITAAHCSESFNDVSMFTRFLHPDYDENESFVSHDYMLVKLKQPIEDVNPVALDDGIVSAMYPSGKILWTLGHGDILIDDEVEQYPDALHHADVKFLTPCQCEQKYSGLLDSSMMCAADFHNGADACQGDSGGPLYDKENNVLVGIVSWGIGCADTFFPGVYSRVADQLPWINAILCHQTDYDVSFCSNDQWSCTNYPNWSAFLEPEVDCSFFEKDPTLCADVGVFYFDNMFQTANVACCSCGGGTIANNAIDRSSFTCPTSGSLRAYGRVSTVLLSTIVLLCTTTFYSLF